MNITLDTRTEKNVEIYFHKTNNETIRKVLPQKAQTVEEAIEDYQKNLLLEATSYGKIILADDKYIGDIWCYCIDSTDTPNAMLSYCIFEPTYWNKGITTEAIRLFISEMRERYSIHSIGAFTFADNLPSIRVLEKNGFVMLEKFTENGILSKYFELSFK